MKLQRKYNVCNCGNSIVVNDFVVMENLKFNKTRGTENVIECDTKMVDIGNIVHHFNSNRGLGLPTLNIW